MKLITAICLLLLSGAAAHVADAQTVAGRKTPNQGQATAGISLLLNASVPGPDGKMVKLHNGKWQSAGSVIGLDTDRSSYVVGNAFKIDLTNASDRGSFEPIIAAVLDESDGGSGEFYSIAVFRIVNGTAQFIASAGLGDRIRLTGIQFNGTIFYVSLITQGPDDGMCCPTVHTVYKYSLDNDKLALTP